jgi:hypothetical protein
MTAIAANDDCSEESDNTTVAIISQRPTRLRFLTDGVAFLSISMLPKYERFKFGEAMTAITLEGDSGHRPPFFLNPAMTVPKSAHPQTRRFFIG